MFDNYSIEKFMKEYKEFGIQNKNSMAFRNNRVGRIKLSSALMIAIKKEYLELLFKDIQVTNVCYLRTGIDLPFIEVKGYSKKFRRIKEGCLIPFYKPVLYRKVREYPIWYCKLFKLKYRIKEFTILKKFEEVV